MTIPDQISSATTVLENPLILDSALSSHVQVATVVKHVELNEFPIKSKVDLLKFS